MANVGMYFCLDEKPNEHNFRGGTYRGYFLEKLGKPIMYSK